MICDLLVQLHLLAEMSIDLLMFFAKTQVPLGQLISIHIEIQGKVD